MKRPIFLMSTASAAVTLLVIPNALAASDPKGIWMDDTGRGAIEIKSCGQALCGYVVAVKSASDTKGCGKQIIGDAQSSGGGLWDNGWIYSPEKRKNYDVELKPLSDGTLRVVGYAGTKLFSRTMIWTRAAADLKRCDTTDAKAPAADTSQVTASKTEPPKAEAKPAGLAGVAAPPASPQVAAPAPVSPPVAAPATSTVPAPGKADAGKTLTPEPPPAPQQAEQSTPAPSPAPSPKSVEADNDDDDVKSGEKPGKRKSGGGLKLGDLDLDKVLTRTKSGKCKLDLPWVKVQFDCERD